MESIDLYYTKYHISMINKMSTPIRTEFIKGKDRKIYKCFDCLEQIYFITNDGGKTFEKMNLSGEKHQCVKLIIKKKYNNDYRRKWMDNEVDYCDCGMCDKCQKRGISVD